MIHSDNNKLSLYLVKNEDSNSSTIPPVKSEKKPIKSSIQEKRPSKKNENSIKDDIVEDILELPKPIKRGRKVVKHDTKNVSGKEALLNEEDMLAQIPDILPVLPLRDSRPHMARV